MRPPIVLPAQALATKAVGRAMLSARLLSMLASMTRVCGALASRLAHDRDTRRLRAMVAMRVPCTNASAMTSRCSVRALVMPDGRPRRTGEEGVGVERLRLVCMP